MIMEVSERRNQKEYIDEANGGHKWKRCSRGRAHTIHRVGSAAEPGFLQWVMPSHNFHIQTGKNHLAMQFDKLSEKNAP